MSLRDFDCLEDRVRLHRQVDKRPVLIVEGLGDKRFVSRLIRDRWTVFIAGTRSSVLTAAKDLSGPSLLVAGLVDRDFDLAFEAAASVSPNIFSWSQADLESELIESSAFDALIEEFASIEKLESFGGKREVHRHVTAAAKKIGRVRVLNADKNWGLSFDSVDASTKLVKGSLELQLDRYCQALLSKGGGENFSAIESDLSAQLKEFSDPRVGLYKGRDALSVLGAGLRRLIATYSSAQVDVEILERALRLAADDSLKVEPPLSEVAAYFGESIGV